MRVLFDQGTPKPLMHLLAGHEVRTAFQEGLSEFSNGGLLERAEALHFDLLITTDKNLRYQQRLVGSDWLGERFEFWSCQRQNGRKFESTRR